MKINLEKEKNNVMKIEVEIDAKEAEQDYNKAVARISQHVNIDGFRKGKAPKNVVELHVGIDRIKQEALEGILPSVFRKVIEENKLDAVAQPYVESYEYNVGEPLKVVARVELRPEVKLGQYKDLSLSVPTYETPEGAFEKSLEALQNQNMTTVSVKDRASKATDVVKIDFDGYVNGEKIKGGEAKNYDLDLANSNFIKGFAEQLAGKKVGEEFDINVTFPENYHEEKLKGAPAVFKIKVNEIKEKKLPELNDEFAKKVGNFKTLDDLKEDIRNYLDRERETQNKKNADATIFNKVIENAKVDIQNSLIEREVKSLMEEYRYRLSSQGLDFDKAIASQNKDELMKNMRLEAQGRIKNSLVIDKIAKDEGIKIDPNDLQVKIEELGRMYNMDKNAVLRQVQQNPEIINSLSQQILNEKVSEFLAANNKVEFTAPIKKAARPKKSTKKD